MDTLVLEGKTSLPLGYIWLALADKLCETAMASGWIIKQKGLALSESALMVLGRMVF